jgi:hypothetical protein
MRRLSLIIIFYSIVNSNYAYAVRPFVTDDARIVDYGQVETESWIESTKANGQWNPAPSINAIGSTSVNDWLQILVGTGTGLDRDGNSGVSNPLLSAKVLFRAALEDGTPGYAISYTSTFDSGRKSFQERGQVQSLVGMSTYRFYDDKLNIHINLGLRTDKERDQVSQTRALWGLGFDVETFSSKTRFVAEVFSGDPLSLNAPRYATQLGMRYLKSDYMQMDFIVGAEPILDDRLNRTGSYATTVQFGLRLLFDAFTKDGKPGNPNGAKGIF